MVRRGSTVRVRQRALQKRRKSALSLSRRLASSRTWPRYGALYGAFRKSCGSAERGCVARDENGGHDSEDDDRGRVGTRFESRPPTLYRYDAGGATGQQVAAISGKRPRCL